MNCEIEMYQVNHIENRQLIPHYKRTKEALIRSAIKDAYNQPYEGQTTMKIPYKDFIEYRWCKKCN